ncbi:hypothetical protein Taro_021639 [Colocasia esculenta]|uniref:Uncharacterized protein n=1 Tax=Colocasia esculenta TaxID=4460 RepID=A0A843UZK5_COLES|nr:hypothetical protein [Colocasia esculenta]
MTHEDKRSSGCLNPDQTQKLELTERSRSHSLPQPRDKLPEAQDPQTVLPNAKAGRSVLSVDVMIGDVSKAQQQPKVDSQNGAHQSSSVHTITKKHDIPSPMKRDGNHLAASVVLKEATDLKHTANRLKKAGLEHESTDLYFQAALKFLHVASLLESSRAESDKHAESTQSMSMYSQTARLCGFCAHEYEKQKEMAAAAALAYKCMEVAYMKVVFSRYSSASKDCHELQTTLHMVPSSNRSCCPRESPSSSALDIENANQSMADKAGPLKSINSPQMATSHVIAAHHRPTFGRLLNFVQGVSYAMEASRKSHTAYTAANDGPEESRCGPEGIASVRKVLNFSFHDVEGLLLAVRRSASVKLWDTSTWEVVATLTVPRPEQPRPGDKSGSGKFVLSVAWSLDGRRLACGSMDGTIAVFDVARAKFLHHLEGHYMPVRSLVYSPVDARILFSASDDTHVHMYDAEGKSLVGAMSGHTSWVLSVDASPDGAAIATGSSDRTVILA